MPVIADFAMRTITVPVNASTVNPVVVRHDDGAAYHVPKWEFSSDVSTEFGDDPPNKTYGASGDFRLTTIAWNLQAIDTGSSNTTGPITSLFGWTRLRSVTTAGSMSGVFSDLPSGLEELVCGGQTSMAGSVSNLPSTLLTLQLTGAPAVSPVISYGGAGLPANLRDVVIGGSALISTDSLDAILATLASGSVSNGIISCPAQARSSASDADVALLEGRGWTVDMEGGSGGGGGGGPGSQSLGFNMALATYYEYNKPLADAAPYQSWYGPIATPPNVDETTGDLLSGAGQMTIWVRGGTAWPVASYQMVWSGGGVVNGTSSPYGFNVLQGQATFNVNATGPILGLQINRVGLAGAYEPSFTARAGRGSCIRMMDAWRTNQSTYSSTTPWVRKPTPTGNNQFFHKLLTPTILAEIARDHGTNLWICVHHLASDANVTQIANDIAATGFSGTVFLERSNEVWNSAFPQYAHAVAQSTGYGGPGDAYNVQAWHADRTHEIGGLFKAVIPSAVVVWGSQMAVPAFIQAALSHCQTSLSNIDAAAIAPYIGGVWSRAQSSAAILAMSDAQIANETANDFNTRVKPLVTTWKSEADLRGWRLLGYEGGGHLDHADSAAEAHLAAASQSSEMGVVYGDYFDWWDINVNDQLCIYQDVGAPTRPWSHHHGELLAPSPRWQAWLDRAP